MSYSRCKETPFETTKKELVPGMNNWELAYAARELRQKGGVTLSCLKTEAGLVVEKLSSFSNCQPVMTRASYKSNPEEIFIEICNQ